VPASFLVDPRDKGYADLVSGQISTDAQHDNDPDVLQSRGILASVLSTYVSTDDPDLKQR
jgi:hypothetical protein